MQGWELLVHIGVTYKSLVDGDFKVLIALEKGLAGHEYVPLRVLERLSNMHEERLQLILRKLHDLKLVKRETIGGEKMYRLTYLGYDVLALRALVKAGIIEAIGDKVGTGKESEICLGLARGDVQVAVKFLRIGKTSFRQTVRVRAWTRNKSLSWYAQSKAAAEREYKALEMLAGLKARVPAPMGYNRHVVVTEFIDGIELFRRPPLENPGEVLEKIVETIAIAYHKAQIVHGDLSEYNILVRKSDEVPFIIDWPQYVHRDDPSATELLKRDVYYVAKFFNKVYGVEVVLEEAFRRVISWHGEVGYKNSNT